jgi:hypothetical protein
VNDPNVGIAVSDPLIEQCAITSEVGQVLIGHLEDGGNTSDQTVAELRSVRMIGWPVKATLFDLDHRWSFSV